MCSKPLGATPLGPPALWNAGSLPEALRRHWGAPPCSEKSKAGFLSREPGLGESGVLGLYGLETGSPGNRGNAQRTRPDAGTFSALDRQSIDACVLTTDLTEGCAE